MRTDLPIAWEVTTASCALPLLDAVIARGFTAETCVMDKGYDTEPIPRRVRSAWRAADCPAQGNRLCQGRKHLAPICEHGVWTFAGTNVERGRAKWRCSTGEWQPVSVWRKASRLHPPSALARARVVSLAA